MMATRLVREPYQVASLAKHTATVIFMHGLGDTGLGWLPVAETMKTELPHVKWLLPNAPQLPITGNAGLRMPAWFDVYVFGVKGKDDEVEDRAGLLESARTIDQHIQDEIDADIPSDRIVVGGFSQGGAMSLLTGLAARGDAGLFGGRDGWKLGGVVALSGWAPLRNEFLNMASPHSKETPVLIGHGTDDSIVPYSLAERTSEILKTLGLPPRRDLTHSLGEGKLDMAGLSFKAYESLGHELCKEELEDVTQFLKRVLPRDY